jgi:hypothetical protein
VKLKLNHTINEKKVKNIFGFDYKSVIDFLSDRDKIKISAILLNSVQLNYNIEQIKSNILI